MKNTTTIKSRETFVKNGENAIYVKYYLPAEKNNCPALICSHGFNGSYADWQRECTFFAEHGFVAVSFDFCGGSMTSKSSGKPTDMTISSEKADLTAVINWVSSLDRIDPKRIYLLGGSQGGLVTALTAEEQRETIAGMILYFPGFCIPEIWQNEYKNARPIPESIDFWGFTLGRKFVENAFTFSVYDTIGGFDKAVLILHGTEDDVITPEYSQKALPYYKNGKLILLPGEKHGFSDIASLKAQAIALDFIS